MFLQPEQKTREAIYKLLTQAGWAVCDAAQANIHATHSVTICEFPLKFGYGFEKYFCQRLHDPLLKTAFL